MLGGGGDEPVDDLGVHVGERVGLLVDVVERRHLDDAIVERRLTDHRGRRVHRGAQEAVRVRGDGFERLHGDVRRIARAEADDGDPRHGHAPLTPWSVAAAGADVLVAPSAGAAVVVAVSVPNGITEACAASQ